MEIISSEEFKNDFQKIKDKTTRLRIPPFRIIYRLDGNKIVINCFDHRKEVYN